MKNTRLQEEDTSSRKQLRKGRKIMQLGDVLTHVQLLFLVLLSQPVKCKVTPS